MKNKSYIFGLVLMAIFFTSCSKLEVDKDVDNCIVKMKLFNNKFEELYNDKKISKEAESGQDASEFEQLKKNASEYYELMNKINSAIEDERKEVEEGGKAEGYEDEYNRILENRKGEINSVTETFMNNLKKIEN